MDNPVTPKALKPSSMTPIRRWILETIRAAGDAGVSPLALRAAYKETRLSKAQNGQGIYAAALIALVMEGCIGQPTALRGLWYIKGLEEE